MAIVSIRVPTKQGALSVAQSAGLGLPLILLHGNSTSKDVFAKQMQSPLGDHYRLIAIDLPGHGESVDASNPSTAYTLPGYAAAVREVLSALDVSQAVLFGWSLGGHVALELAARWKGALGVALCGAPPACPTPDCLNAAFAANPILALLGNAVIGAAETTLLARTLFGLEPPAFLLRDIRRTDTRARPTLFESFLGGNASDARKLVEFQPLPIAIIDGSEDPLINHGYATKISFAALWEGTIHHIDGAGHAPFWQHPQAFNQILLRFMRDMVRRSQQQNEQALPAMRRLRAVCG